MENKKYMKYMKLSILSVLLILPLATAIEQTCQIPINVTTQFNITGVNETINLTTAAGQFNYNSSINFSDSRYISILQNATCSLNISEGNVSDLWNILYNISKNTEIISKDNADRSAYFNQYTGCLANYSVCQAELNISQSKQDFQDQYQKCVSEKADITANKVSCENQLSAPATGCLAQKTDCEDKQKKSNDWILYGFIAGVILGGGGMYMWKVKKKVGTDQPYDKEPLKYQ